MKHQPRTVKRLSVSEHFIADTFVGWDQRDYVSLPVIVGVPHDTVVERVVYDPWRCAYGFILSHPSFAVVEDGADIPAVDDGIGAEVRSFKVAWVDDGSQATIEVPVNVACLRAEIKGVRNRVFELEDENAKLEIRIAELEAKQPVVITYQAGNEADLQRVRDKAKQMSVDRSVMVIPQKPTTYAKMDSEGRLLVSEPEAQRLGAEQMRERCAKVAEEVPAYGVAETDACFIHGKHIADAIRSMKLPSATIGVDPAALRVDKTVASKQVIGEDGKTKWTEHTITLSGQGTVQETERGMLFTMENAKEVAPVVYEYEAHFSPKVNHARHPDGWNTLCKARAVIGDIEIFAGVGELVTCHECLAYLEVGGVPIKPTIANTQCSPMRHICEDTIRHRFHPNQDGEISGMLTIPNSCTLCGSRSGMVVTDGSFIDCPQCLAKEESLRVLNAPKKKTAWWKDEEYVWYCQTEPLGLDPKTVKIGDRVFGDSNGPRGIHVVGVVVRVLDGGMSCEVKAIDECHDPDVAIGKFYYSSSHISSRHVDIDEPAIVKKKL